VADDDSMDREMTLADLNNEFWGPLTCYSCDEVIAEPGAWLQMRPYTAYPFCKSCIQPDPAPSLASERWNRKSKGRKRRSDRDI